MSYGASDNPTSWLDEALRDVPLPADLIARLRRLGVDNDGELAEALRRVAVPEDLTAHLKQIPDDAEIDRRLRRVPVRAAFVARLKEVAREDMVAAGEIAHDAGAEGRTSDARPVTTAAARQGSDAAERMTPWIVAASLVAVVSLAALGYVTDLGPVAADSNSRPVEDPILTVLDERREALPRLPSPDGIQALADDGSNEAEPPERLAQSIDRRPSEIVGEHASVLDSTEGLASDPLLDAPLFAMEQLAMPDSVHRPRPLGLAAQDRGRGVLPPTARGFDWAALLRDGAFPFVSPGDHPQLTTLALPLLPDSSSGTGSFRELVGRGLAIPQEVRTEEFLAAVEYGYHPPNGKRLALHISGGPSPWDPLERKFLLLGVQARGHEPAGRAPVDVTFVIDASLNTPGMDALAACREALGQTVAALQPEDRVSIILAAQRPVPLAQGLGLAEADELMAAVEQLARIEPQPIVDMVPAVQAAVRRSAEPEPQRRRLVVCVTSDLAHLGRTDEEELSRLVAAQAAAGMRLDVVRLSPVEHPDAVSGRLARAGGGEVHAAQGSRELWATCYRLLTTQSPVAARNVSLTLQFDPQVVESYRVLGHEMYPVGPVPAGDGRIDLLLQDTCVVMLELELRHSVAGDVATARLEWHEPQAGDLQSTVQRIGPAQFATALAEAPLPLQRATLAAMAAEILGRNPHIPADASLQDLLAEADAVDSPLWDEAWFADLLDALSTGVPQHGTSRGRGSVRAFGL